jgi:hypothetical protein
VKLNDLLSVIDRAAANLAKLEEVWHRAEPFIPSGPAIGSHPEYDDLRRTWDDLLVGLPKIDGCTITESLPEIDVLGHAYLEFAEMDHSHFALHEIANKPTTHLAEYRFRLHRARRRAARRRLEELTSVVDSALPRMLEGIEVFSPALTAR